MIGNVIQPNGASSGGGIDYVNISNIDLGTQTWAASSGGLYYTSLSNVIPANVTTIGIVLTSWSGLKTTDILMFSVSGSNPRTILIACGSNEFSANTYISIRVAYI